MADIVGKIPPQNIEAEQSVLGSLLLDKDAIVKVADILTPYDFYKETHGMIYKAVLELYEKKMPIDVVTLTDQLEKKGILEDAGGASYLTTLVNSVPSATRVVHYANIVQQKSTLRRLIQAASKSLDLGYQEDKDIESVLDEAEQNIFSVSQKFLKQYFVSLKEVLAESFERIDKLHKHKGILRGVPTGFDALDNLLAGLQPSDLIILAGRPSMGKSSLVSSLILNAAIEAKVPVGFFSLEMSKEQVVDRFLCAQAGVDSWKLRTGNLEEEDFPKIGYAMGVLSEAPIFIDDSAAATPLEIRTKARRLQSEHGLGLLVIDYLQMMYGSGKRSFESRVQEVSEISRSLKGLAKELNIPVLAVSQLSRAVEQRPSHIPQLSDLRESGCLAGNTLILRPDTGELIPIKNLVGKQRIPCLSLGEDLKLKVGHFSKVFPSGKKMVFKLKTATGRKIRASANHPFLTLFGWRRLDELKEGDSIAVPRVLPNIPVDDPPLPDSRLILLAHLIGDGCYLKSHALQYTNADRECLKKVAQTASSAFGISPRLVKQKNWFHVFLPAPFHLTHRKRNPIVKWLDEELGIFNQRSGEKIIPRQIFKQSLPKLALFLKHLWATDGTISWSRKGEGYGWTIFYSTKSENMARQIQHLLLRFGIISRLRNSKKNGYEPGWVVDISGKEDQLKFLKSIGIFGQKNKKVQEAIKYLEQVKGNPNCDVIPKEIWSYIAKVRGEYDLSWRDFAKKLKMSYCGSTLFKHGISRKRLKRIFEFLPDKSLKNLVHSDIYWDKIVSIEKQGIEEVYDATVLNTHNFVANDFIVENSIEQDSDVVMFIYREDYYDKNTERKNIADILIKKHRNGPIGQVELYFIPEQMRFTNLEKKREK